MHLAAEPGAGPATDGAAAPRRCRPSPAARPPACSTSTPWPAPPGSPGPRTPTTASDTRCVYDPGAAAATDPTAASNGTVPSTAPGWTGRRAPAGCEHRGVPRRGRRAGRRPARGRAARRDGPGVRGRDRGRRSAPASSAGSAGTASTPGSSAAADVITVATSAIPAGTTAAALTWRSASRWTRSAERSARRPWAPGPVHGSVRARRAVGCFRARATPAAGPAPLRGWRRRRRRCAAPSRTPGGSCRARCAAAAGGFWLSRPPGRPQRGQSQESGMSASAANDGVVTCPLAQKYEMCDAGRGLAALGLAHRTGTHPGAADRVAACHGHPSLRPRPSRAARYR